MAMIESTDSQNQISQHRQPQPAILYLILALALVRGLIYLSVVPPWQAPDEPAHFERAKAALNAADWASTSENPPAWYAELRDSLIQFDFLDYTLRSATASPEAPLSNFIDLYQEVYGGLYGSRPTYAVIGWPLLLAPGQEVVLQLYLLRLGTVAMNLVILYLAYLTTRLIFPNNEFLSLGVPLLILFNPQHTHMLSTVNNGNLTELLAVITLYLVARGLRHGFSLATILVIGSSALAAMWTKATGYFLIIPLATIGLFYLWEYRRRWPYLLGGGLAAGIVLYFFSPARLAVLAAAGWSFLQGANLQLDPFVPERIFRSFWAMPGWAIVRLEPIWYQILLIFSLLSLIGLGLALVRHRQTLFNENGSRPWRILLVFGVAIVAAGGIQLGWHILTGTLAYSQGRTIYPVIVPIAVFLMLGWQHYFPLKWKKTGLLALTMLMVLFDSMTLLAYIFPFFYSRY